MSIKISVVMASFLSEYEYSATERISKFHRAIESFLNQSYENRELIVVADGCPYTAIELAKYSSPLIKLTQIDKQPLFSGNVRNTGFFLATGDVIAYLDTDDFLGVNHIQAIADGFSYYPDVDWVYFNDYIIYRFHPMTREILSKAKRDVELEFGTIGTSSIAHKKIPDINWNECDGYGHDWTFIKKLIDSGKKFSKIDGTEYCVCHIPNSVDN